MYEKNSKKKEWQIPQNLLTKDFFQTFRKKLPEKIWYIAQWRKVKGLFQTPQNRGWNLKLK